MEVQFMATFNTEINQLFPQTEHFKDFSGTTRKFDFYIRELSIDDYSIIAQDSHNQECRFEAYLNTSPRKELALLKMEIVRYLGTPCFGTPYYSTDRDSNQHKIGSPGSINRTTNKHSKNKTSHHTQR